jgi:hypothetical protein
MDPRGPERRILEVVETRTEVEEGIVVKVSLRLECGHLEAVNPIFSYRVGDNTHCFKCGEPNRKEGCR